MNGDGTDIVVSLTGIQSRAGERVIHQDLDLEVGRRQIVALVGDSGSGKTTLLRHVMGLTTPTAGRVSLFGQDLASLPAGERRALCRRLGVLFQGGALYSALSVFDNIAFPLRELRALDRDWITHLVMLKLAMVELEPEHGKLMPAQLSGGMVKRVALARALALEPELLLLDEPTAGLDPDRSRGFVSLVGQLQRELGLTVIMVTHDLDTLADLATHVAVLAGRRILTFGPMAEVMAQDHPFAEAFRNSGRRTSRPTS